MLHRLNYINVQKILVIRIINLLNSQNDSP